MKRVIKRAVSFVLVFMTVFSVFTILPSEVFHTAYVKAAEMFSSETGASTQETYTTDDFTYTLIDEYSKVQILSYIGSDTDVVIPDRIDNKKVTSIADSAFREKSITSVVFGQYVESIGNYAFYGCQSLSKLDFSKSSVKTIGSYAFVMDKSITTLEFPDSLESIGNYAFSCYRYGTYGSYVVNSLKSVKFGSGLKTIGQYAFYENQKLETIEFTGNSLTSIENNAFHDCLALKEVNLTGNNAVIGDYAFYNNDALQKITLSGVKTIGSYAFGYGDSLKNVSLGEGLVSVKNNAFQNCFNLETANFSDSLTTISNYAFDNCRKLTEIDIPSKVETLSGYAFSNCSALKNVSIGSGCTSISSTAFLNSYAIEKIDVAEDNKNYASVDGALLNKEKTSIVLYPKNKQGEFVIPDTVTTIADYAFNNAPNLTKVTIGANVKTIGTCAFQNCNSLETVIFKDSDTVTKTIGDYAFNNCPTLTTVDFGNAVKSIGSYAFMIDKSLENIEFPDSLESIGNYAFSCYRYGTYGSYVANSLKSVKFGSGLKTIGQYAFYENQKLETIEFT